MALQRLRNPRSAVERLRIRGGHNFDEDNETHIEAFVTLRRRSQVAGGSGSVSGHQLAAYIRSLDRPVWRPVEPKPIVQFWAAPRANFPDGLPAAFLPYVVSEEYSARSALSRDAYYFIEQVIDRSVLGVGVLTCSCAAHTENHDAQATGDVAARRDSVMVPPPAMTWIGAPRRSIVTPTADGPVTGDGGGASAATGDVAARRDSVMVPPPAMTWHGAPRRSIVTPTADGPVTGDGGVASAATGDAAATGGGRRLWRTGGHRDEATGGLRFLEHGAVQREQAEVSFWAVPQVNFPEGLPPLYLAAVVPAEHTRGCPFSWADYFFIGHIIERICLGANVIYCTNVG